MMRAVRLFRGDKGGVGAVEFALILPLLVVVIVGIAQMGILYFAHAGLRNLVGDGARFASISPRPTDAAIKARMAEGGFGLAPDQLGAPTITYCNSCSPNHADVSMSYSVDLNFVFYDPAPFQINETRRVFINPVS